MHARNILGRFSETFCCGNMLRQKLLFKIAAYNYNITFTKNDLD